MVVVDDDCREVFQGRSLRRFRSANQIDASGLFVKLNFSQSAFVDTALHIAKILYFLQSFFSSHKLDNKSYLPQGHTDYDLEETDTHTFSWNRLRVLLSTLKRDLPRLRNSTGYDIAR